MNQDQCTGDMQRVLPDRDGTVKLHIILDCSSIEVFANNGCAAISARVYPAPSSLKLDIFTSDGSISLKSMDIWKLKFIV